MQDALRVCVRNSASCACALWRSASRSQSTHASYSLGYPTIAVWAPNTGVGKTLVSAALVRAGREAQGIANYLKPVQTGFPEDSDGRLVAKVNECEHMLGQHAQSLATQPPQSQSSAKGSIATLFAWRDAVSPHLAVANEGRAVSDADMVNGVLQHLDSLRADQRFRQGSTAMTVVETAGGVCSPAPSGALQVAEWLESGLMCRVQASMYEPGQKYRVDALRPLRLPALLIADGRLGGISATVSAYESLLLRGYDIVAVVGMEPSALGNLEAIEHALKAAPSPSRPHFMTLPNCEEPKQPAASDTLDPELRSWLSEVRPSMRELHDILQAWHDARVARLDTSRAAAQRVIWWPFTQHSTLKDSAITIIDARAGESFVTVDPSAAAPAPENRDSRAASDAGDDGAQLRALYDGCASWWTQGVSARLAPAVTAHVAYASGRYSHVIFPESIHEPALKLSEMLLQSVGRGWASRVFFTDNGSTAVEVALKMAFKAFASQRGFELQSTRGRKLHIVALDNGYHGDTLGTMDCAPESVFNAGQTPWYQPRGLFLEPPSCGLVKGVWEVQPTTPCTATRPARFDALEDVFDDDRLSSDLAGHYKEMIVSAMEEHEARTGCELAACLLEPVMQGAGGMIFVDPLFHKVLVKVSRAKRIPVIADEVFSGLWRLGHVSAMSALNLEPDIACYAKLLTAGAVPMAVTLASEEVFDCFSGDTKAQALLHGHSYTAHPIGCQVAVGSLEMLGSAEINPNIASDGHMKPIWSMERVSALSHRDSVDRVVCLGTVLAVTLKVSEGSAGYSSNAARSVTDKLRKQGVYARPLGNVVYLMCTPTTNPETTDSLLTSLEECLGQNNSASTAQALYG